MENLCYARENSVQFFLKFFYTFKLRLYGALKVVSDIFHVEVCFVKVLVIFVCISTELKPL
jgi:hypothetical protein